MEAVRRRCCGIDVHKKSLSVHVRPPAGQTEMAPKDRVFRTFSRDLRALRGWLRNCGVTEVVMESTGQYWRPVWNVLEGEIPRVILVNPVHVKALAGRKTDRIDSRRLAGYLERQELDASFVPMREIRELRDLMRSRVHLLEEVNRVKNRIGQMCEAGNIKITSVASDLFGVSGRRMLKAIVEGRRDPGWMADYAKGTLRRRRGELEQALDGTFTDHQRWMLDEELKHLEGLESQIGRVEAELGQRMQPYAEAIRRLKTIPGVDGYGAWTIVAELGTDMTVFPDARHAASWAGMCPGNRESGGKRMSGRTRKGNLYLRRVLAECAWAASHTKNTYLSALYRRLRARIGHHKAVFAVAHQILVAAYTMLKRGEDYRDMGADYFDQREKPRVVNKLIERLSRLGYYVTLQPVEPEPAILPQPRISPPQAGGEFTATIQPPETSPRRKPGRPCKCAERGLLCHHQHRKQEPGIAYPSENTSG